MGRLKQQTLNELKSLCPGGVELNVSLADISQWRIGGNADVIIRPSSTHELAALRQWFFQRAIKHVAIGATSNLLFADEGLRVPCIQMGSRMAGVQVVGQDVRVKAGTWVPSLARALMQASLTGGEHICGIPGTVGGLICMNGGSQRKGIGNSVTEVESVTQEGSIYVRNTSECAFDYRRSVYQENNEIISSAQLTLTAGDKSAIRKQMLDILASRSAKFPRKQPNCGSVFKSNPKMYQVVGPPGEVIEKLGFKGRQIGGALVSPHHANFIVNTGEATCADVVSLIREIASKCFLETGFRLEVEAMLLSADGELAPIKSY